MDSPQTSRQESQRFWRKRAPRQYTKHLLLQVIFLIAAVAVIVWIFRQIEPTRTDPFSQPVVPRSDFDQESSPR